jgi:hypothetical protein
VRCWVRICSHCETNICHGKRRGIRRPGGTEKDDDRCGIDIELHIGYFERPALNIS